MARKKTYDGVTTGDEVVVLGDGDELLTGAQPGMVGKVTHFVTEGEEPHTLRYAVLSTPNGEVRASPANLGPVGGIEPPEDMQAGSPTLAAAEELGPHVDGTAV